MAILVASAYPNELIAAIIKAVKDGKIDTWERDESGDFTHTPTQWREKAWLRPSTVRVKGSLVFSLIGVKGVRMSKTIYAVYHGRFSEMLLTHFDSDLTSLELSANRKYGDSFS